MARESHWLVTSRGQSCRQRSQSAFAGTRSSMMLCFRCVSTATRSASDHGRFSTPRLPGRNTTHTHRHTHTHTHTQAYEGDIKVSAHYIILTPIIKATQSIWSTLRQSSYMCVCARVCV